MSDSEDNFRNLIGGAFGQMEATLGPEAYQAQIDVHKTMAEYNRKQIDVMQSQIVTHEKMTEVAVGLQQSKALFWFSLMTAIRVAVIIGVIVTIPVVVMLWRAAL